MLAHIVSATKKIIDAVNTRPAGSDYTSTRAGKLDNLDAAITSRLSSAVKSVQRGTASGAGTVTISSVNTSKSIVLSNSKGSAGYVAARGTMAITSWAQSSSANSTVAGGGGSVPPSYSGSLSGGTTDLTVKVYSAVLTNSTTVTVDGPCEWQVIEYN